MSEHGSDLAGPQGTLARLRACVRVLVYACIQGYSNRRVCARVHTFVHVHMVVRVSIDMNII